MAVADILMLFVVLNSPNRNNKKTPGPNEKKKKKDNTVTKQKGLVYI